MFYDIYKSLCEKKGISPSRAAEEMSFNRSSVSNWKKNGYTPRREILVKIADYFDTTVDSLLGENDSSIHEHFFELLKDEKFRELAELFSQLSPESARETINYVRYRRAQEKGGKG
ncbi:helix-turn-helix transcriptional regulator [Papillibacter cinnamivorans]|uniref:DNA-binding transcriptional regulator, XRE-family HTH domain n=1 Tax=Papillibacter cinnamivorans DSM 12816 TaxID=1122930 RepID=A0A1W1YYH6_9FIRM|nr:helix-turn-helix transcriptional regulator [Papillibacter cinnamivorans]SMC41265.1 DNA-binding transcriptional regulator, XRE-family HTH domain [Papillibacter cinnamivorans DSM 12816]